MLIDTSKYKNIIFDFGGVIINIDYNILVQSFRKIGLPHFESYFSQASQRVLFDDYEKGMISSDEFRNILKAHCQSGTTDEQIDAAWNSMILDLPRERLELLRKLKTYHRTFLLSNTNEIHMNFIYADLQKIHGIRDLSGYFDKIYLSYEMGMRKPDQEIFKRVIEEQQLKPAETLFIDDSPQHIESAKKLGLESILLNTRKTSILEIFQL